MITIIAGRGSLVIGDVCNIFHTIYTSTCPLIIANALWWVNVWLPLVFVMKGTSLKQWEHFRSQNDKQIKTLSGKLLLVLIQELYGCKYVAWLVLLHYTRPNHVSTPMKFLLLCLVNEVIQKQLSLTYNKNKYNLVPFG